MITKLSQGVTRGAPETSIGMVEETTTATPVLPPEPVPSGFTTDLLFFFLLLVSLLTMKLFVQYVNEMKSLL